MGTTTDDIVDRVRRVADHVEAGADCAYVLVIGAREACAEIERLRAENQRLLGMVGATNNAILRFAAESLGADRG